MEVSSISGWKEEKIGEKDKPIQRLPSLDPEGRGELFRNSHASFSSGSGGGEDQWEDASSSSMQGKKKGEPSQGPQAIQLNQQWEKEGVRMQSATSYSLHIPEEKRGKGETQDDVLALNFTQFTSFAEVKEGIGKGKGGGSSSRKTADRITPPLSYP